MAKAEWIKLSQVGRVCPQQHSRDKKTHPCRAPQMGVSIFVHAPQHIVKDWALRRSI
jgi:hypothetical protein